MWRWLKISLILGIVLLSLVTALGAGIYWFHYYSTVQTASEKINAWKKNNWKSHKVFGLVANAIVAAEDPTFFKYPHTKCGFVDILESLLRHKDETGCSHIIFHASKLVSISESGSKHLGRHFKEITVANELALKPDEALDIVLNKSYMGMKRDGIPLEGFEQAAKAYYDKSLGDLSLSETAMLAGMIGAPGKYGPNKDPDRGRLRRDAVIDQMLQSGDISETDANSAKRDPI